MKNGVSNDYCKLKCILAMGEKSDNSRERYLDDLMIYCMLYDMQYFIEIMHKEQINKFQDKIDFIYLYYLEKNNKEDIEIKNMILEKYKNNNKKIIKEIKTLNSINFNRKLIKYDHRKKEDIVIKKFMEIDQRLNIIAECMKYKLLIKYLKLENNSKIDRILKWNISLVKRAHTIENKLWLM